MIIYHVVVLYIDRKENEDGQSKPTCAFLCANETNDSKDMKNFNWDNFKKILNKRDCDFIGPLGSSDFNGAEADIVCYKFGSEGAECDRFLQDCSRARRLLILITERTEKKRCKNRRLLKDACNENLLHMHGSIPETQRRYCTIL